MDLAHPTTLLLPAGVAALVGWRLYSRVRRMVGRQRLSNVRPWVTVTLFPLLLIVLLLASLAHPYAAIGLVAGVGTGVGLGVLGLRLTRFEATTAGLFYTPDARLGIALSLLLVGRIAYRMAQLYADGGQLHDPSAGWVRSPLTLLILGTLAGYHVAFAAGLLRWRQRTRLADHPTSEIP